MGPNIMAIKFQGKAVPFTVWTCMECPSHDRAKRSDGLPSNLCVKCEARFLKTISDWKSKQDPLWFIRSKKEKAK